VVVVVVVVVRSWSWVASRSRRGTARNPNRADPAIEVLQLPAGATEADWYDAVTALIEANAYWALFPEEVVSKDP
jgi:hypothetical protein